MKMIFFAVFLLVISSVYSQVCHCHYPDNGLFIWSGLHDKFPSFDYDRWSLSPQVVNMGDVNVIINRAIKSNQKLADEETPKSPVPIHPSPPPPRPKINLTARFNGSCLNLPGDQVVNHRQLESMIRDVQRHPSSIPVLSPSDPMSLAKYLKTTALDRDPLLERRMCVFDSDVVVSMPAVLSVISFCNFLEEQSRSSSPVHLSPAEAENVAAFLEYLTHKEVIKIICLPRLPFKYVQKILPMAPAKVQENLILKLYNFRLPFKCLKTLLYRKEAPRR